MHNVSLNYIVRIYRCDESNPRNIVGVVEEPGIRGKRAFNNYDELWEILNPQNCAQKQDRGGPRTNTLEKRRDPRFNTSNVTEYSLDDTTGEKNSEGIIVNSSESGMCLLTPRMLNEGETIVIKRDLGLPCQRATVRWSRQQIKNLYRAGLEFDDFDNLVRDLPTTTHKE